MESIKILLVDDEKEFVNALSDRIRMRGLESDIAHNGEQALELVVNQVPDVMILDLKMPKIDGMQVLKHVKETNPEVQIIILTGHAGHGSQCKIFEALYMGAFDFIEKPVDIDRLIQIIRRAYKQKIENVKKGRNNRLRD